MILNLKHVDYIDSTGLGTMVICFTSLQKAGGGAEAGEPQPRNIELLLLTKLSTVFQIFGDEQESVNSFFPGARDQAFRHPEFCPAAKRERAD